MIWPDCLYLDLLLTSLFHVYCLRLPSFNLYYAPFLPYCLPSSSLAFLTFVAPSPLFLFPSLLSLRTMWPLALHIMNYWGETQHSSAAQQITDPLSSSGSSPLTISPLCIDVFCSLISTSGRRSDLRFLRVTWDLAFFHSFGANPEEFGHCNPAAHASLVTAGGRAL